MKFVCSINSSLFETSSGWDLCFFGGECLPSADECKCPPGYGPDQTIFSETKNCAMPRMALEILFGCFLVLWLWIGWMYVRFASKNQKKLKRIHTATTTTHLALFVYMLWTTITHKGDFALLTAGTTYLLCLIFILCEVSLKMLTLKHNINSEAAVRAKGAFSKSIPVSFGIISTLAITAMVYVGDKNNGELYMLIWFTVSYAIIDVYILCLYAFTQSTINLVKKSNIFREDKLKELMFRFHRMRMLYVMFGTIATTIVVVIIVFKWGVGSFPLGWVFCLIPIATYGAIIPLIVIHTYKPSAISAKKSTVTNAIIITGS